MMIIDPPPPFASAKEWEDFIRQLEAIQPRTEQIREELESARKSLKAASLRERS